MSVGPESATAPLASVAVARLRSAPSMIVTDVAGSGEPLVRSVTRPEIMNGGPGAGLGAGVGAGSGAGDGVGVVGASAPPHAIRIPHRAARTALLNAINEKAGSKRTRPTRTFEPLKADFLLTFPLFHFSTFHLVHAAHAAAAVSHRGRILLLLGNLGDQRLGGEQE